jgi:hypothetical protein
MNGEIFAQSRPFVVIFGLPIQAPKNLSTFSPLSDLSDPTHTPMMQSNRAVFVKVRHFASVG